MSFILTLDQNNFLKKETIKYNLDFTNSDSKLKAN